MDFSGVITALATPFKGGVLDRDSFFRILKSQADEGISQFVINGTTGESPVLEEGEVQRLCSWLREFESQSRRPLRLILGTGTFSTKASAEKTKKAADWGADAALVVTPYYSKPSQAGLLAHFQAVAKAAPALPILLYNVPSRTGVSLDLKTIKALAKTPNIKGIKEASGDLDFFRKIRAACSGFALLSGDDGTAAESFFLEGNGVISVASHVLGREFLDLFQLAQKEKPAAALQAALQDALQAARQAKALQEAGQAGADGGPAAPARESFSARGKAALQDFQKKYGGFLRELYKESNPIGIKQVLHEAGLIASPELRLPLKAPARAQPALKAAFRHLKKSF